MNNLYNYDIYAKNGQITHFEAKPNKHSKELNKESALNLFKGALMSGKVYSQDNEAEYFIFDEGQLIESQEPREGYIFNLFYDNYGSLHEIKTYKEPQTKEIGYKGEIITFDKMEIETLNKPAFGGFYTYAFYYYKGELIATD